MNKRRLLLLSVFALLHITTSERNFIDGRCCNHSSRYLSSDTSLSSYDTHRVQRFLSEIRQVNNPQKYPNPNVRDNVINQLSRRRQTPNIEQRHRDNENREFIGIERNRILTSPIEEIRGKRKNERSNAFRNDFRHNRFARLRDREHQRHTQTDSFYHNDNRKNDVTKNHFDNRDINRYNCNDRDAHTRYTRNNGNELRRILSEQVERNTPSYENRNNMRNDFDHVTFIRSYTFPRKSELERIARQENNLRIIRTMRSDEENLNNDRNSRVGTYRNIDEELFERASFRKSIVRDNVRSNDEMNFKDDIRCTVSDRQIKKRSLVRDTNNQNSFTENRKRSVSVLNRVENVLSRDTRDYLVELRQTSRLQMDYNKTPQQRMTSTQSDRRQNFNRIDVYRETENRLSKRRNSSEKMYASRDERNDARIQFDRRNAKHNVRYNRDINERDIHSRINVKLNRNRENVVSRQHMEVNKSVNTFKIRQGNKDRYSESRDIRYINENRLTVRHSYDERILEDDKISRHNLLAEFQKRDELRRSKRNQRNIDYAFERIVRPNREAFTLTPEIRERYDSSRNLRESRYIRSSEERVIIEREDRQRSDNNRIRYNGIQRRTENQLRLTIQHQNRITSRIHRNIISVRSSVQIARANVEDDFTQRARIVSNTRLTNSRRDTRETNNEQRSFNMRRITAVLTHRRYAMTEFTDNNRFIMTHEKQYEQRVFEMKWQYLFYALQMVYLCSVLMMIPKDNGENRNKKRITEWFTPAQYLKID